jgi:acyl carrier protein
MTRKEFIAEIALLMEIDAGILTEETRLKDMEGWDSLAAVGFIAMVDEKLGYIPPPKMIAESQTIGDLVQIAVARLED